MEQDNQASSAPKASDNKVLYGVLSYIGPLVIISYLLGKDDPFVKFHVKQGLVLFCCSIIVWAVGMFLPSLFIIWSLVNLGILILSIIGIVNVVQHKEKEIPLVGSLSHNFKF